MQTLNKFVYKFVFYTNYKFVYKSCTNLYIIQIFIFYKFVYKSCIIQIFLYKTYKFLFYTTFILYKCVYKSCTNLYYTDFLVQICILYKCLSCTILYINLYTNLYTNFEQILSLQICIQICIQILYKFVSYTNFILYKFVYKFDSKRKYAISFVHLYEKCFNTNLLQFANGSESQRLPCSMFLALALGAQTPKLPVSNTLGSRLRGSQVPDSKPPWLPSSNPNPKPNPKPNPAPPSMPVLYTGIFQVLIAGHTCAWVREWDS